MQSIQQWEFLGVHRHSFDMNDLSVSCRSCSESLKWRVCTRWFSTFEAGQNSSSSRELLHCLIDNHKRRLRKWLFRSLSGSLICSRCHCCWGALQIQQSQSESGEGPAFFHSQHFLTSLLSESSIWQELMFCAAFFQCNPFFEIVAVSQILKTPLEIIDITTSTALVDPANRVLLLCL